MTWLDRLLVAAARAVVWALHRRSSLDEQRVWWLGVTSVRPDPATFGNDVPDAWPPDMIAGKVLLAFGVPSGQSGNTAPRPLLEIMITRRMLDTLGNGTAEVCGIQDIQLQALRANQGGKLF